MVDDRVRLQDKKREEFLSLSPVFCCVPHRVYFSSCLGSLPSCQLIDLLTHGDAAALRSAGTDDIPPKNGWRQT